MNTEDNLTPETPKEETQKSTVNLEKKEPAPEVNTKKKSEKAESALITDEMTEKASLSKKDLVTAFAVFLFALLVIFIHLNTRENWQKELQQVQKEAQVTMDSANAMLATYHQAQEIDSLQIRAIKMNYFDAYDESHFRIYGLFRDDTREYSVQSVAKLFNISSPNAIKKSEVGDEFWFIVPVKGIHYVQPNETALSIAQKYYFDKNAVTLIETFNHQIKEGQMIFIPFN